MTLDRYSRGIMPSEPQSVPNALDTEFLKLEKSVDSIIRGVNSVTDDVTALPAIPAVLDDLTDVDTTTTPPADGDVLTSQGGIWVPQAPAAGGGGGGSLIYGTVDPTTEGADGDFYINTATDFLFGPKAAGTWPAGTSLVGPTGAAGATGPAGADGTSGLTLIERRTLGADSASETFSSLGSYTHLLVRVYGRNTASLAHQLGLRFNGDSGGNYTYQRLSASGAGVSAANVITNPNIYAGSLSYAAAPAGAPGLSETHVYHYRNTAFHKATDTTAYWKVDAALNTNNYAHVGGMWHNTTAIASLAVVVTAGSMAAGTIIEVYGQL